MTRKILLLAICLPGLAVADSLPSHGEFLSYGCASCHNAAVRPLAGRNDVALKMRAFRAEGRDGVMNRLAQGFTDAEINALDDYFSSLSP